MPQPAAASALPPVREQILTLTLTGPACTLVGSWPPFRHRRPRRPTTMGPRSPHTMAVNRAALTFLDDAHMRGDEFAPLDWTPEVAHAIRDGAADGERVLIADALMRYTRTHPARSLLRAFIEVDRATESSETLATKLIAYARFHSATAVASQRRGVPTVQGNLAPWQRSYPVYPRVLIILTGAGPRSLGRRVADLQAMVRRHPLVGRFATQVPLGAAVLEELEEYGASASVWAPLDGRTDGCSWMDL